MSLKKEIISNNGAIANYHRISRVEKNGTSLVVTVNSYADNTYRETEKELEEIAQNRDSLITELSYLSAKSNDDLSEDETVREKEIQTAFERMNTMQGGNTLFKTNFTLSAENMDGISFQDIYNRLKTETEVFGDAEDC